jgi:E3 ubiquitin-protein ligase UBR7
LAGMCSGCAFNCHRDHEVENLYFKRKFRCDCGNSKFSNIILI